MKFLFILVLCSCSIFSSKKEETPVVKSDPIPLETFTPPISKVENDFSAAVDQTKSFYCIKNGQKFKENTCEEHAQRVLKNCSKKFKNNNKVLNCLVKSLKI